MQSIMPVYTLGGAAAATNSPPAAGTHTWTSAFRSFVGATKHEHGRWLPEGSHLAAAASRALTLSRKAAKRALAAGAEEERRLAILAAQILAICASSAFLLAEVAALLRVERSTMRLCLATGSTGSEPAPVADLALALTGCGTDAQTGASMCLRLCRQALGRRTPIESRIARVPRHAPAPTSVTMGLAA